MPTLKIWLALEHPEFFLLSWSWIVSILRLSGSPEIQESLLQCWRLECSHCVMVSLSSQKSVVQAIQRGVYRSNRSQRLFDYCLSSSTASKTSSSGECVQE